MNEMKFDFESGHLSLDYANTANWHGSENPVEYLNTYADFVAWGEAAHLLTTSEAAQLRQQAAQNPDQSAAVYNGIIQLRDAIYTIFSSRSAGAPIPSRDMETLNSVVRLAMAHLQLVPAGDEIEWDWVPGISAQDRLLWSIGRSTADLLTSDLVERVRECEDDRGCGYLFIDQSKNRSRRWCSMESCGNRAKARRHYSKVQEFQLSSDD